jgi:hypothetical protein
MICTKGEGIKQTAESWFKLLQKFAFGLVPYTHTFTHTLIHQYQTETRRDVSSGQIWFKRLEKLQAVKVDLGSSSSAVKCTAGSRQFDLM